MKVERLDHLGIIAGTFDELKLGEFFDEIFEPLEKENISISQAVKGLVLNGLGFSDRPLSLVPQFFEHIPLQTLISSEVSAEDFNRHKLGRTLDCLYSQGCSSLFSQLSHRVATIAGIDTSTKHLDTTSFSVTGQGYDSTDEQAIKVKRGYSKDFRPDLRQIVHELVVSGDGGFPLIAKSFSGNASDNKVFRERAKALIEAIKEEDLNSLLISDSKLYSSTNIDVLAKINFLTRPPNSIGAVKENILKAHQNTEGWLSHGKRSYQVFEVEHYGLKQRWIVVLSPESIERSKKSTQKKVDKEKEKLEKQLFHLQAQRFGCKNDAEKSLSKITKKWKFHNLSSYSFKEYAQYDKPGKPAKEAVPKGYQYQVYAEFQQDLEAIKAHYEQDACYLLGTNVMDREQLGDTEAIDKYTEQQKVERGFRFLKDPLFFVSSLFLKKPERLEALLFIMSLSLLVYSVAERKLRKALQENDETLPNQIKKPTKTPTLRWVFQCLFGINIVKMELAGQGESCQYAGIDEHREKILRLFGPEVRSLYGLT